MYVQRPNEIAVIKYTTVAILFAFSCLYGRTFACQRLQENYQKMEENQWLKTNKNLFFLKIS